MSLKKRIIVVGALWVVVIALTGCAGSQTANLRTQFVSFNEQQQREYQEAKPKEYRIQQGDELALVFSYLKDLNQYGVIVLPDGSVTLPEVDRVVVKGRTISEVDSLITSQFARSYRNPDLSILVEKTLGRQVYVLGEVKDPGLHSVPYGGIGILSAISAAGGFTEDAQKSSTVLVRMNDQGYLVQEIDLSRFHTLEGISYTGVNLETYDVVYVPRSRIGDFAYFSKSVLSGVLDMTQIFTDLKFIESGYYRR